MGEMAAPGLFIRMPETRNLSALTQEDLGCHKQLFPTSVYCYLKFEAAFLKLLCGLSTPGDLGEMRVLILQVWEGGGADGAGLLSIL